MEDEVKKQLRWRLAEKPTVENLEKLVTLEIITKKEAKEILLSDEEGSSKSLKDLGKEMALLRELVLDIAKRGKSTTTIIEKYIDRTPYYPWKWPYVWYGTTHNSFAINTTAANVGLTTGTTIDLKSLSSQIKV